MSEQIENTGKATKITPQDMQGLMVRATILATKQNELDFLNNENKQYWNKLVKRYKLDPKISYDINQASNMLVWRNKNK